MSMAGSSVGRTIQSYGIAVLRLRVNELLWLNSIVSRKVNTTDAVHDKPKTKKSSSPKTTWSTSSGGIDILSFFGLHLNIGPGIELPPSPVSK